MPTRGQAKTQAPKEQVFDKVVESCKQLNAKVKNIDKTNFRIEGHSPTKFTGRFGSDFEIVVSSNDNETLVTVTDFFIAAPNKQFIEPLFRSLAKSASFTSGYIIDKVDASVQKAQTQAATQSQVNVHPMYKEIQMEDLPYDPFSVKRYEYDAEVIEDAGFAQLKAAEKICVFPIEIGNKLVFTSKNNNSLLEIGMGSIQGIAKSIEKGKLRKKDDLVVEIVFDDAEKNQRRILVNMADKMVNELLGQIHKYKTLEGDYWEGFEIDYTYGDQSEAKSTAIYFKTPFLSRDEELLWSFIKTEGIVNKRIFALAALTNFRAFIYLFDSNQCARILFPAVDDVIVMNAQRMSQSFSTGVYSGRASRYSAGVYSGSSTSTSQSVGDIVFMMEGKEIVRFSHVGDPHGVASLAKAAIKQLKPASPANEVSKSETRAIPTDSKVCNQCGNANANDAKFCNKCGKALSSVCPKCQKANAQGASFCAECGLPLS